MAVEVAGAVDTEVEEPNGLAYGETCSQCEEAGRDVCVYPIDEMWILNRRVAKQVLASGPSNDVKNLVRGATDEPLCAFHGRELRRLLQEIMDPDFVWQGNITIPLTVALAARERHDKRQLAIEAARRKAAWGLYDPAIRGLEFCAMEEGDHPSITAAINELEQAKAKAEAEKAKARGGRRVRQDPDGPWVKKAWENRHGGRDNGGRRS